MRLSIPTIARRFATRGYLIAVLLGVLVGDAVYVAFWLVAALMNPLRTEADWWVILSPVQLLVNGQGALVYDQTALTPVQNQLGLYAPTPYQHHPAFLLLVYPFSLLPPGLSYLAWLVFNVGLLALALVVLARNFIPNRDRRVFVLLAGAFMPVAYGLRLGQTTSLLLFALTPIAVGMLKRKDGLGGLGLAALLIKPHLVPLLCLTLLWRRRFRAFAWFSVGALAVAAVSYLLVGSEGLRGYAEVLAARAAAQSSWVACHTLMGLAYVIVELPASYVVYALLALGAAGAFLFCLSRAQTTRPASERSWLRQFSRRCSLRRTCCPMISVSGSCRLRWPGARQPPVVDGTCWPPGTSAPPSPTAPRF